MRSKDARRARFRAISAAVGVIGGTAIGAFVLWQGYQWALLRFVYRNETYAIRRIEVRHDGFLRADQIRRWADVALGQNLLALDLDRVRHDLEFNPWIRWADVQAQRPDCLRISVWEREPLAQIVTWRFSLTEQRAWPETNYVDAGGCVLPSVQPDWVQPGQDVDFSHLPRLAGLEHFPVIPGQALRAPHLDAAIQLIRAYEDSALYSLVDLEEVDLGHPNALRGTLRGGIQVVFGTTNFDRQMRLWRSIHDYAQAQGRVLESIDLSVTNNIPARWRDSADAKAPRPAKPKRTPRHHV